MDGWGGLRVILFCQRASATRTRGVSLSVSLWLSINNLAPRRARTEQSPCVHFSGTPVQSFELGDVAPCTETLATHSHAGCNQLIGLLRDVLQAPRAAHEMRNNKSRAASAIHRVCAHLAPRESMQISVARYNICMCTNPSALEANRNCVLIRFHCNVM
jgi:hypothetical protein